MLRDAPTGPVIQWFSLVARVRECAVLTIGERGLDRAAGDWDRALEAGVRGRVLVGV
jgi:hypothetical protein